MILLMSVNEFKKSGRGGSYLFTPLSELLNSLTNFTLSLIQPSPRLRRTKRGGRKTEVDKLKRKTQLRLGFLF
jgi:hypothetical protein